MTTTLPIDHIVTTPDYERPHIRGTHVRVQDIAAYYKGAGVPNGLLLESLTRSYFSTWIRR